MPAVSDLFDPRRHEPSIRAPWSEPAARTAIERICDAAEREFDEDEGSWLMHPQDEPPQPGARSCNFYWGAAGVVWALRDLAAQGAVGLRRDYTRWIEQYPERVRREAADEQHGSASYFFGEGAPLLLAWRATRREAFAERLHGAVLGNLHNTACEPLWGNAGTLLAALHVAEASKRGDGDGAGAATRWQALVQQGVEALHQDMVPDAETGTWLWRQDLYGRVTRYLGAGHGLAGNAYAAVRAEAVVDAPTDAARTVVQRAIETLSATALQARLDTPAGQVPLANWHVLVDKDRVAAWLATGGRPLVQDCHGAPGIVCRLAGAHGAPRAPGERTAHGAGDLRDVRDVRGARDVHDPRDARGVHDPRAAPVSAGAAAAAGAGIRTGSAWDDLLLAAGELTWHAGPLAKGPSLCHGTAGSAMACLKLWRRFGDPLWLERARHLAMHAAGQVEQARAQHGRGRQSLWTGDLGVACVLWNCVRGEDRFPSLDHF